MGETQRSTRTEDARRVAAVIVVSAALTLATWQWARGESRALALAGVRAEIDTATRRFARELLDVGRALQTVDGLFASGSAVQRSQWQQLVESLEELRRPAVRCITYAEGVHSSRLSEFELEALRSGVADHHHRCSGHDDDCILVKFGDPSASPPGADLAPHGHLRDGLWRARDTNSTQLVRLPHVERDTMAGADAAICVPVFRDGPSPEDRAGRLRHSRGWLIAGVSMQGLLGTVLGPDAVPWEVSTADGQASAAPRNPASTTLERRAINAFDHQVELEFALPATVIAAAVDHRLPAWTLAAGIALTMVLATSTWLIMGGRRRHGSLLRERLANRNKSAFLAAMSHEIRTPMTAILGYANLLDHPAVSPEEHQSYLATIRRNGEHLLAVLDDILDLSKLEAGRLRVERVACSPGAIARDVVALLQERAHAQGLALTLAIEDDVPGTIHTDPTRFRQILLNLIGNAIKFTPRGSVRVRMWRGPAVHEQLCAAVRDTGVGIPRSDYARIFEPFRQADELAVQHVGGTGLGLAISSHLARALGGGIHLDSAEGEGSCFTVRIASGPCFEREPAPAPERGATAAHHPQDDDASPLAGRVLLAEDSADNRRLISTLLHHAGIAVQTANDGSAACQAVESAIADGRPFDLILMDMQMPVMDGLSATRRLIGRGVRAPIVALTAHAMESDRQRCIESGCADFVPKPIVVGELLDVLRRYLVAQ